jgi:hypothetical protein
VVSNERKTLEVKWENQSRKQKRKERERIRRVGPSVDQKVFGGWFFSFEDFKETFFGSKVSLREVSSPSPSRGEGWGEGA